MKVTPELELNTLSDELKLLLSFMISNENHPTYTGGTASIDWEHFSFLAEHHRVYPSIISRLKDGKSASLPNDTYQFLYRMYTMNTFRMMQLTAEMIAITGLFHQQGVSSLVLKGPALAERLYGDLSLRTSKDLDLLVSPNDLERTLGILLNHGYVINHDIPRILNELKWKTHHISFTHPVSGIQIELHWRLNHNLVNEPEFDELWERRNSTSFSGHDVYHLGNEDLFVYLISHGAHHGWFRLRWLADIDRMLKGSLSYDLLYKLLVKNDCVHLAGQALILSQQFFLTPIPDEMRPLMVNARAIRLAKSALVIIRDIVYQNLIPSSNDVNKYYHSYIFALMSARQKWAYFIGKLYPSSLDAELLPLPQYLHFLYFPLRPFLWCWRQMKHQMS